MKLNKFDSKGNLADQIDVPDPVEAVPNIVAWRFCSDFVPKGPLPGLSQSVVNGVHVFVATDPSRTLLSPGDWVVTQGPSCVVMTEERFTAFRCSRNVRDNGLRILDNSPL